MKVCVRVKERIGHQKRGGLSIDSFPASGVVITHCSDNLLMVHRFQLETLEVSFLFFFFVLFFLNTSLNIMLCTGTHNWAGEKFNPRDLTFSQRVVSRFQGNRDT